MLQPAPDLSSKLPGPLPFCDRTAALYRCLRAAGEWKIDARAADLGRIRPAIDCQGHDQGRADVGPPPKDVEASRLLGRAAVKAMLAVAAQSPVGATLESNISRSVAVTDLGRLPGRLFEVFCRCDRDVAAVRYRARAGSRGAGYFDRARTENELWNDEISEPMAGGWPVIEVGTNSPVDPGTVVSLIRAAVGHGPGT